MKTSHAVPGRPGQPNLFRRNLPERVRVRLDMPLPRLEPEVAAANERAALRSPPVNWRKLTAQDLRDFLLAYCACFVALQAFLA
ncbi:hypothetical protein [Novosphingobium sp. FSW06-99]|uniref:hypothetical protein n=1 Tax=Novosphingobium sp. FSW06-99 TaxID=1739113 RepID=UPI00076D13E4|nr:hypothetical protein [Novosphingobium sp. FSW06-99]KUR75440.1 hypothetical protein AQZ49_15365 [Novosphingobium sp. FSW06-99]